MHLRRIVIASICLFPIQIAIAQLPQNSRHAGGIAVIPLSSTTIQVFYEKKPILIAQEGTQRYAIFGIPLKKHVNNVRQAVINVLLLQFAKHALLGTS